MEEGREPEAVACRSSLPEGPGGRLCFLFPVFSPTPSALSPPHVERGPRSREEGLSGWHSAGRTRPGLEALPECGPPVRVPEAAACRPRRFGRRIRYGLNARMIAGVRKHSACRRTTRNA